MSDSDGHDDGTPAGWYDDPLVERWWDGSNWTKLTRPRGEDRPDGPIVQQVGDVPPGWYADPLQHRYWDGIQWTSSTRDLATAATTSTTTTADTSTSGNKAAPTSSPASSPSTPSGSPVAPGSAKRKGRRNLLFALLGVAALGGGFGAVLLLTGGDSTPDQAAAQTTAAPPAAVTTTTAAPATTTSTTTSTTTTTTTTSTTTTTAAPVMLSAEPYFTGVASWTRVGAERMLAASVPESPAWGYARHLQQGFRAGSSPEGIAGIRDLADGESELCIGNTCTIISDVIYRGDLVESFSVDGTSIAGRSIGWPVGEFNYCWYVNDAGCFTDESVTMSLTSIYRFGNTAYVSVEVENGPEFESTVEFSSATAYSSVTRYDTNDVATPARPGQTEVWIIVFNDLDVSGVYEINVSTLMDSDYYSFSLRP